MVLRTFYHTRRQTLLWVGLWAARGKITVNVTCNRLYCARAAKYNLAGRGLEIPGFLCFVDRASWYDPCK